MPAERHRRGPGHVEESVDRGVILPSEGQGEPVAVTALRRAVDDRDDAGQARVYDRAGQVQGEVASPVVQGCTVSRVEAREPADLGVDTEAAVGLAGNK